MPRLAICSRDLHWYWINRTLLCDTMEVSMLSRAWLTIAQYVFQPALTGRPELISRKIVSGEPGTKAIAVSRFREKLSPANWVQGVTAISRKNRALGRQKNGVQHVTVIYPIPRYTRPRYIGLTLYWTTIYIENWLLYKKWPATFICQNVTKIDVDINIVDVDFICVQITSNQQKQFPNYNHCVIYLHFLRLIMSCKYLQTGQGLSSHPGQGLSSHPPCFQREGWLEMPWTVCWYSEIRLFLPLIMPAFYNPWFTSNYTTVHQWNVALIMPVFVTPNPALFTDGTLMWSCRLPSSSLLYLLMKHQTW